jgi:signal transduction histidine kinase
LRDAVRNGEREDVEYRVRLPSGKQCHHAGVIVPIKDAEGMVLGIQGTVQDVTPRKEVEMRLRHKEAQLEEAQQVARMGSWEWLPDAASATWSSTLYRILGFDAESPIPEIDRLLAMLAPESRDAVLNAAEQTLRTGEPYEVDLEVICPGGAHKWLTCRGEARRNGDYIVGLHGTVQDITERRGREAERAARERHMHELSRRLVAAQEDERRRLAAELHDRTSPNLAAVQLTLGNLRSSMPEDVLTALSDQFEDLRALLQDATTGIRDVCAELRPALLDYAGLVPTLENHIQQFSRRTGILVKLEHRGLDGRLGGETEALLFRIVQEALTNCAKHAEATTVRIALRKGRRHLVLTIVDDGVGFDPAKIGGGDSKPGLGLLTMRERAEFAGGSMRIDSAPGRGTTIRAEL